jgi:hypothetical protein
MDQYKSRIVTCPKCGEDTDLRGTVLSCTRCKTRTDFEEPEK